MGSESFCFVCFRISGGEGRDVAASFVEELERQMAQSADPDDTHSVGRLDAEVRDRPEHRDPTAESRPGFQWVHAIGQLDGPVPVAAHPVGEAAVATEDRLLGVRTKVLASGQARVAAHARTSEPAESDAVADLHAFGKLADRLHDPHCFVTGDQWENRISPLVVDHRKVGVADPAGLDADLHLFWTQWAGLIFEGLEGGPTVGRRPCVKDFSHAFPFVGSQGLASLSSQHQGISHF